MAKSKGKNPRISPLMAPDKDESYHDNYGVLQHMADGGLLDSVEDYLNKLGASTGQQSQQQTLPQEPPPPPPKKNDDEGRQYFADGGESDDSDEDDTSIQLSPDEQKSIMNYVNTPQDNNAKMQALGMIHSGENYDQYQDRMKAAGYPEFDPTGVAGIEDVGARAVQRVIPAAESLVGQEGLAAQRRIAQQASLDRIAKEAEEMNNVSPAQAENHYGNKAAEASNLADEAREASANQYSNELAKAKTPQQQQALENRREVFERLYKRARGGQ
jgi:hypothetical protein